MYLPHKRLLCILLAFFVNMIFLKNNIRIDLSRKIFQSPFILISTAITGWLFMYSISLIIIRLPFISNFLILLGKSTMEILALHFLAFKLIIFIKLLVTNREFYLIAAFPTLEPVPDMVDFLYHSRNCTPINNKINNNRQN